VQKFADYDSLAGRAIQVKHAGMRRHPLATYVLGERL